MIQIKCSRRWMQSRHIQTMNPAAAYIKSSLKVLLPYKTVGVCLETIIGLRRLYSARQEERPVHYEFLDQYQSYHKPQR